MKNRSRTCIVVQQWKIMKFWTIRASCEPSTIVPGAATGIHGHAQSVDSGDPGFQGPTTRDSGAWIICHSDYAIAVQSDNIRTRTHEIMNRRGRAAQRSRLSSMCNVPNARTSFCKSRASQCGPCGKHRHGTHGCLSSASLQARQRWRSAPTLERRRLSRIAWRACSTAAEASMPERTAVSPYPAP